MNNSDFSALLNSSDAAVLKDLTKRKRKKKDRPDDGGKKKKHKPKPDFLKQQAEKEEEEEDQYVDRAALRRDDKLLNQEYEQQQQMTADESKYMGGDLDHTHLVKGLDYALLSKVKSQVSRHEQHAALKEQQRQHALAKAKRREFNTALGRNVYQQLVAVLHPHHRTFKERMQQYEKMISRGIKVRGGSTAFEKGRMNYCFHLDRADEDLPTVLFTATEEIAKSRTKDRKAAPIPPKFISSLKTLLEEHQEQRRQRRLDRKKQEQEEKERAPQPQRQMKYVIEKEKPRIKAKDADDDIFGDAGGFNASDFAKKVKMEKEDRDGDRDRDRDRRGSRRDSDRDRDRRGSRRDSHRDRDRDRRDSYRDGDRDRDRDRERRERESKPLASKEKKSYFDGMGKTASDSEEEDELEFEACAKFQGPRPGWTFKNGDQGLGYYQEVADSKEEARAKEVAMQREKHAAAEKQKRLRARLAAKDNDDAYGELFPSSNIKEHNTKFVDPEEEKAAGKKGGKAKGKGKGKGKKKKNNDGDDDAHHDQQWQQIEKIYAGQKDGGQQVSATNLVSREHKQAKNTFF